MINTSINILLQVFLIMQRTSQKLPNQQCHSP